MHTREWWQRFVIIGGKDSPERCRASPAWLPSCRWCSTLTLLAALAKSLVGSGNQHLCSGDNHLRPNHSRAERINYLISAKCFENGKC